MCKTIFHLESIFYFFFYADSVLHLGSVFQSDLLLCLNLDTTLDLEGVLCSFRLILGLHSLLRICFSPGFVFLLKLSSSLRLCFSLRSVFHSDLLFTHSAFHSVSVPHSNHDLQLNLVLHLDDIFQSETILHSEAFLHSCIFVHLLFFIQILLFIKTSLKQILLTGFNPNIEKNASFCESHWFSIDFSLFT